MAGRLTRQLDGADHPSCTWVGGLLRTGAHPPEEPPLAVSLCGHDWLVLWRQAGRSIDYGVVMQAPWLLYAFGGCSHLYIQTST